MPAYARRMTVVSDQVGVYHCTARCIRRAYLCGIDPLTGKDHEHRKEWIRELLQKLASIFAIDICGYAVMSNHLHVVLRSRPDLVHDWTDREVAIRWKRLFPTRDPVTGGHVEPTEYDLQMIVSNPERVSELRDRLASLSWFMRCLCEPIARRANGEDECTGRFWEGRFTSQILIDEAAILACSVYVDLNPIRAGIVERPEESEYTSAFDRIQSMTAETRELAPTVSPKLVESTASTSMDRPSPPAQRLPDEWLCELTQQEGPGKNIEPNPPTVAANSAVVAPEAEVASVHSCRPGQHQAARASDQGYLPIALEKYLSLLDWTGRQLRANARGTIPAHLAPILERLGVNGEVWVDTVRHFGHWFKRAVGRRGSLASLAARSGRRWFQGQRAAAIAFG